MTTPIEAATAAVLKMWGFFTLSGKQESPGYFSEQFARTAVASAYDALDVASIIRLHWTTDRTSRGEIVCDHCRTHITWSKDSLNIAQVGHIEDMIRKELLIGF